MAVYKIFPEKDASIYSEYPFMNTGIDAILEASSYLELGSNYVSRYLIKFSTNEINEIINNKISGSNFKVSLKNKSANILGLNKDTTLEIYPVSESWDMGTGKFNNSPITTNGVSWKARKSSGLEEWTTSNFAPLSTGSYNSISGGGTWFTGSNLPHEITHTQSYSYSDSQDLNVDVTGTILTWYSGAIDNEGFIVKLADDLEFINDANLETKIKNFSIDTNTIYPPELEFKWDDFSFNTSSNQETLNTPQALISLNNVKEKYYPQDIARFRITSIPQYPQRNFQTSSLYIENYILPENESLYAIKDTITNEYIIDFDPQYTKISSDEVSSYFDLYMNGLEPERNYTVLIKTKLDGVTKIFNSDIMFKVSN